MGRICAIAIARLWSMTWTGIRSGEGVSSAARIGVTLRRVLLLLLLLLLVGILWVLRLLMLRLLWVLWWIRVSITRLLLNRPLRLLGIAWECIGLLLWLLLWLLRLRGTKRVVRCGSLRIAGLLTGMCVEGVGRWGRRKHHF